MNYNYQSDDMYPLVSLVITSYNRSGLIRSAIESALAQDYPNLEIIISDNCSTDFTNSVIEEYLSDARLKFFSNEENIGMLPNFIKATSKLAKGKFITYVSSDDYLVNDTFISEAISRIQKYPALILVHSINATEILLTNEYSLDYSYEYYKNTYYKNDYVTGKEVFADFPKCHSISLGGTLFDRTVLMSLNPFQGSVFSADTQLILQLLLIGEVAFIDKETYVVRRHGQNMTSTVFRAQTYIDNLDYIEKPYRFAVERNQLDKSFLAQWREDMYCNFCSQCMLNLFKAHKSEFAIFSSHIRKNHPVVFKRITSTFNWRLNKIIHVSEYTSSMYSELTRSYRKIKSILRRYQKNQTKYMR